MIIGIVEIADNEDQVLRFCVSLCQHWPFDCCDRRSCESLRGTLRLFQNCELMLGKNGKNEIRQY